MEAKPEASRQRTRFPGIALWKNSPIGGILEAQETSSSVVIIIRLDEALHLMKVEAPVSFLIQGLWLDSSECRGSSPLINVGMCLLPDDILISSTTMCQQRTEVTLRSTRYKKTRLLTKQARRQTLESIHAWVITEDIISDLCLCHDLADLRAWPGHRIAPEVDLTHCQEK